MDTTERQDPEGARAVRRRWPIAVFTLIWLFLLIVPTVLALYGAVQTFQIAGSSPVTPRAVEAQRRIWLIAIGIAFALPALGLGLGLALGKKRKVAAIAFGITLVLFAGAVITPTNRSPTRPNTVAEWMFQGPGPYPDPFPDPPAGCFGDSPADKGNPACRGG